MLYVIYIILNSKMNFILVNNNKTIIRYIMMIPIIPLLIYIIKLSLKTKHKESKIDFQLYFKQKSKGLISLIKSKIKRKLFSFPSGIMNYSNNCYINVLLQCLSSLPEYQYMCQRNTDRFIQNISYIIEQINDSSAKILYLHPIIKLITNKFKFANEQQDSFELFNRLNECFDSTLLDYNPFKIEIETKYSCSSCKNSFVKSQIETNLSFEASNSFLISLEREIQNFSKVSLIYDYNCISCSIIFLINQIEKNDKNSKLLDFLRKCLNSDEDIEDIIERILCFSKENKYDDIIKRLKFKQVKSILNKSQRIKKTSNLLLVHFNIVGEYGKSESKVNFKEFLHIGESIFELVSFIVHYGSSSFGHYICYRKFYNSWIVINDSNISFVNKNNVFSSSCPYMMFYQKIK